MTMWAQGSIHSLLDLLKDHHRMVGQMDPIFP